MRINDLPSVKELRAFDEVHRAGRIVLAADRMALTHSAVSVLLRQLEGKLGVALFERTTRALRPTEAALALLPRAQRLLADLQEFAETGQALAGTRASLVRVAVTPMVAQTLLPHALARFGALGLDAQVLVDDCAPADFLGLVQAGKVDMGIGAPGAVPHDLDVAILHQDRLVACGVGLGGGAASLQWKDLAGASVITLRQGFGLRSMIESSAQAAGVALDFRHEVTLLSTAFALAAQKLGVVILPSALARLADMPRMQVKRLTRPVAPRDLYLVTRKGARLPAACLAFRQAAQDVLRELR